MKKHTLFILLSILIISCSSKEEKNMVVQGQIRGLEKGTLYLQKKVDGKLINVDSVTLFAENKFKLYDNVKSPEIYLLTFNKNKKILFFGEASTITINDNIEEFGWKPIITGSKNQTLYDKFKKTDHQFKMKKLDYIAKDLEARAKKDTITEARLKKEYLRMRQRRAAYAIQFALNHKDNEVAPYIAMVELFDANFIYIDSINNRLTEKIKKSTYGKELQSYVDKVNKSK